MLFHYGRETMEFTWAAFQEMPKNVLGIFKSGICEGFCEFQTTASQTPAKFEVDWFYTN